MKLPPTLSRHVAARAKKNRRTEDAELALLVKFALGWLPVDVEGLPPRRLSKQRGIQRHFSET